MTDSIPPDLQPEYEAAYDAFQANSDDADVVQRWLDVFDKVVQARLARLKEDSE